MKKQINTFVFIPIQFRYLESFFEIKVFPRAGRPTIAITWGVEEARWTDRWMCSTWLMSSLLSAEAFSNCSVGTARWYPNLQTSLSELPLMELVEDMEIERFLVPFLCLKFLVQLMPFPFIAIVFLNIIHVTLVTNIFQFFQSTQNHKYSKKARQKAF